MSMSCQSIRHSDVRDSMSMGHDDVGRTIEEQFGIGQHDLECAADRGMIQRLQ
jgi:hypothetical protein